MKPTWRRFTRTLSLVALHLTAALSAIGVIAIIVAASLHAVVQWTSARFDPSHIIETMFAALLGIVVLLIPLLFSVGGLAALGSDAGEEGRR